MKKVAVISVCFLSSLVMNNAFAQVVINEVMPKPTAAGTACDQTMANAGSTSCGKEYVEIYNTSSCNSVDISCYILASKTQNGNLVAGTNIGGAFAFPSGTVIPPLGHLVIGGPNANATAGSVDFILPNYVGQNNLCLESTRWFLENTSGWVGLYNTTGAVVDAIFWTFSSGQQATLTSDVAFSYSPCLPSSCGASFTLKKPNQMVVGTEISYVQDIPSAGQTFSRVPDGGTWQRNIAPTIAGSNNCNGGTCNTGNSFFIVSNVTQPACGSSNGNITVTPSPAGTYTYTWTPNVSTTNTASSLAANTYAIHVVSSTGCTKDTSIVLSSGNAPTAIVVTPTNPSCGQTNGTVVLGNVTGGVGPYQFNFNNAGFAGTQTYNNLASGSYTLVVKDANGCTYNAPNISLTSSNAPTAIVVTPTNPSCGQTNGTVGLGNVTGGVGPYQYNFNNAGFAGTQTYNNLASGSYTLVVKDANGCTYNAPNISLTSSNGPTAIAVTPTNPSCGQSNGTIALGNVTGGTSPYQYNFNGLGLSATLTYNNLAAGSYTLVVQDANGCSYTAPNISLSSANGPTAITVTPTNPSCGQSNGTVVLGNVIGGTSPYQYNFNGLGLSSTLTYNNLASGSYTLVVQDAGGCVYTAPNVALTSSNGPTAIVVTPTNPSCGQSNGTVVLGTVTGGTSPYQYNFNALGLSSTLTYNNLAAGSYTLVVQDANGCVYNAPNVALSNSNGPTAIVVTPTNTSCGQSNGSVVLGTVTGGTSPYQYNFNGLGLSSTLTYNNLASGSYTLIVQDANGCSYTAPNISLSSSNGPTAIIVTKTNTSCGQANGSVSLGNVTGGTLPYQYNFNGSGLSSTTNYNNISAGTYSLVVQDANGCAYTVPSIGIINVNSGTTPLLDYTIIEEVCGSGNGSIIVNNVYGANSPYLLNFNSLGFSSNTLFDSLSVGQYLLQIKDASGCVFDSLIDVTTDENQKAIYAPNCFTPNSDNLNDKWNIKGNCIKEIKIFIFNRWGEKIFTITDLANGWDGIYSNNQVPEGVYVYNAEITFYDRSVERQIGHITLLK